MFDASQNINYKNLFPYNSINDSSNIQTSLFQSLNNNAQRLLKSLLRLQIELSNYNIFWYDIILQIISTIPASRKSFLKDKVLSNTSVNLYNQIALDLNINSFADRNFCIIGATIETKVTGLLVRHTRFDYPKIILMDLPITQSPTTIYDYGLSLFNNFNKTEDLMNRIISLNPQILISVKPIDEDLAQKLLKSGIIALSSISSTKMNSLSKYLQCEIISKKHQIQSDKIGSCQLLEIQITHNDNYVFTFSGFKDLLVSTLYLTENNVKDWTEVQKLLQRGVSFLEYINFEDCFLDDYGVMCSSVKPRRDIVAFDKAFLEKFYAIEYSLSPYVNVQLPFLLNECIRSWKHHVGLAVQQFNTMTNKEEYKTLIKNKKIKINEYFTEEYLLKIAELLTSQLLKNQKNKLDSFCREWDFFKRSKPNLLGKFPLLETCFLYYTFSVNNDDRHIINFCQNPVILLLEYYSPTNDLSIEDFISQETESPNRICEKCNDKLSNHGKSYIRNNSKLTIIVKKSVADWFDDIYIWNKQYSGKTLDRKKLSNNSKLFSFAKLLDLMLLPKDCLHFRNTNFDFHPFKSSILCFGLRDTIVEVQEAVVNIFSIDYNLNEPDNTVACINNKNERYICIQARVENMFDSIYERIWSMGVLHKRLFGGSTQMESKMKETLNFINLDKQSCLGELLNIFMNTDVTDSISMNPVIFKLQQCCIKWNKNIKDIELELNSLEKGKSFEETIKRIPSFQLLTYLYMNSGLKNNHYEAEIFETSVEDDLTVETFSTDDVDYEFSQELKIHENSSSKLCELALNDLPEQFVSKVSMVPKLKVKTNTVKEKISQMEALISGKCIYSNPKSPSLKSPLSEVSSNSFNKDLVENKVKVTELKIYFDDLQNKFKEQLEEQKKMEKKLKNNKCTLEIYKEYGNNTNSNIDENSDVASLSSKIAGHAYQMKPDERFSNFSACGEISFNDAVDETLYFDCDSVISDKDFSDSALNIIKEKNYENSIVNSESERKINTTFLKDNKDFKDKSSILDLFNNFIRNKSIFFSSIQSPLDFSEHIFPGSNIVLHDDQPSSFISFTLLDKTYLHQLSDIWETKSAHSSADDPLMSHMLELTVKDCSFSFSIKDALDFSCNVYFVEQFEAFRGKCEINSSTFAGSLSLCLSVNNSQWKTKDSKFYLTELTDTNFFFLLSALPDYFSYFVDILFNGAPSFLSTILGVYTLKISNNITGEQYKKHLVVTENSTQSDYEIIKLNNNLLKDITVFSNNFPILMRYKSSKLLKSSLLNDTNFLESIGICGITVEIQKSDSEARIFCVTNLLDIICSEKKIDKIVTKDFPAGKKNNFDCEDEENGITYTSRKLINFIENYMIAVPDEWHL